MVVFRLMASSLSCVMMASSMLSVVFFIWLTIYECPMQYKHRERYVLMGMAV